MSHVGPEKAVVGAIISVLFGGGAVREVANRLAENNFALPRAVVVDNAFNFFNVSHTAAHWEINYAYRQHCLRQHPDRGGDHEHFVKGHVFFAVIKAHKNKPGSE